jgi:hypothetical protein
LRAWDTLRVWNIYSGQIVELQVSAGSSWKPLDVPANNLVFGITNTVVAVEDTLSNGPAKYYRVRVFEP